MVDNEVKAPQKEVDELSAAFDEALDDFASKPKGPVKSSDDDLDEFLAPMDTAATKKAADDFQKVLREFAVPEAMQSSATSEPSTTTSAPSSEFLTELLGLKQFMDEENVDSEARKFTKTLLRDCFTKEWLLPLVRQFTELVDESLAEESSELSATDRINLKAQREVLAALVTAYEESSDPPTAEQAKRQNELWARLRDCGDIPPQIITQFESRFQPPGGGIPNILGALGGATGGNAEDGQCSLM